MAKRSELRDTAKAVYVERRARGEKVNLREMADTLGASYKTLRDWKTKDKWDDAVPGKKRGGQPGNRNSRGKRNAAGSHAGAPPGNRNAEKDGAYSRVYLESLGEAERAVAEAAPLEARAALEHEMKILKLRENRILLKINEYEAAPEDELYTSSTMEIRKSGGDTEMVNRDSAFTRVLKLQEALYKVQGRISKIADSLRMMDENAARMQMERERLEIMRIRATGVVDDDEDEDGAELPEADREDVVPEKGGGK